MSDSKTLADSLLIDLERMENFGPAEAQTVATLTITLAINELRKAISDIGKAADATAGFTADIAAHLVDDDGYDDEGDFLPGMVTNVWNPSDKPFVDFANLRIA